MAAVSGVNTEVTVIELEDTPPPPPPPPALKKRATKRGLSKLASAAPEDPPDIESHVTNVYSSCVQRSAHLLPSLPRKPLFSKQSDNTDTNEGSSTDKSVVISDVPDVQEIGRPLRKRKTHTVSTTYEEPDSPTTELDDDLDVEDENSALDDVSIIRSPSPPVPPPPPSRQRPKRKRVSRGIREAFKAIDSIKGELMKGLGSPQTPTMGVVDSPEHNDTQLVRVRHMEDIHRFSMDKTEMFYSLQTQMADLLGVAADQIGLYLNDSRLGSSDSPLSKRLHLADIIVCHILVSKEGEREEEEEVGSIDDVRVQMQCSNSRHKLCMVIKKFHPFRVMMERYAEQQGKPLEKFRFHFDGELLLPDMFPKDVELDDDDTIDVVERK